MSAIWTCLECGAKHTEDVLFLCGLFDTQICPLCQEYHMKTEHPAVLDLNDVPNPCDESELLLSGDDDGSGLEPAQR